MFDYTKIKNKREQTNKQTNKLLKVKITDQNVTIPLPSKNSKIVKYTSR